MTDKKRVVDDIISELAKIANTDANEATTRLKIIDRVLFEILDWTHDDTHVEHRVSEDGKTTFADYVVKTASTAFILEAKKIGVQFDISSNDRKIKLNKSNLDNSFGEAVRQARDYCRGLGIQFAVVTNGKQWAVFPATRIDNVDFASSFAISFKSLEDTLRNEFDEFHSLLSRRAVINSSLENKLLGYNEDQNKERRLNNFFRHPTTGQERNPIYPLIENEIITAFSDAVLEMDPSLFEKCYVNSPDRIKFDRRINMHIAKSEHLFSTQPIRPMQKKESGTLKQMLEKSQRTKNPLAIVILGTVGAGKTTFLHYTRKVSAQKIFEPIPNKPHPHWVRVDFLSFTLDEKPIDFIYKNIKEYINESEYLSSHEFILNAYQKEILAIKRGPSFLAAKNQELIDKIISEKLMGDYNAIKPYVDTLIEKAVTQSPIFLVIDNVDQLSESVQSQIFTDCIAFAKRLKLNLVISLRNSTYVEHRNSPAFNAFDFDPILIEPPLIESVLSKRFFIAWNLISGKSGEFVSENGMTVKVNNLADIIDLVQSSVLGTEVGHLLEVLAAGDVRNALRMTREFLENGYSNPGKAIHTYKTTGKYILPRHEALRAILLGSQAVYKESYSPVGNPFDSRLSRNNLQMLRLFILSALVQYSSDSKFQYLDGTEMKKHLRAIGIGDEAAIRALNDLCNFRFIHTSNHSDPGFDSSFYPSRLGGYIVRELISNFTFIENVMMDTFIEDDATWDQLMEFGRKISNQRESIIERVKIRADRARVFFHYMNTLYSQLLDEATKRALPLQWRFNPLEDTKNQLETNLSTAIESASKNYGQSQKSK